MKQRPKFPDPPRSQRALARLLGAGSVAALLLASSQSFAQADIQQPPPNLLLLVDTSGSMDYKTGDNSFPTCRYADDNLTAQVSQRSRWIDLVEVLTGSINDYECQRLDRNGTLFRGEYQLGGNPPYDALYPNPYHRPASGTCVMGPGTLDPGNASLFPSSALTRHPYNDVVGTCDFNQANDGVLDNFLDQARFGLMTFDTEPRPAKDVGGLWSYYLSSAKQGEPAGCLVPQDQEVGVRNPTAPPWEGRAVGFGDPAKGSLDFLSRNAMIQKVLLATRPYGATPIAGMLDDARAFLSADVTPDPLNMSLEFGPTNDPAIKEDLVNGEGKCRTQAIILLSDGQPNMDLRPFCEPGGCPYNKAEDIAQDLHAKGIDIYVIGFALSKVMVDSVERSCKSFAETDFNGTTGGICEAHPNDSAIQACCSLNRIAAAGGHPPKVAGGEDWQRAHFADNRDELRNALGSAIAENFKATSRTPVVPVAGPGFIYQGADLAFARGFRFNATVTPKTFNQPWVGGLNRSRYVCTKNIATGQMEPELLQTDASKGDDFVLNVNTSGPNARTLFTVLGDNPVKSDTTIRPNLPPGFTNEGAGTYSGTLSQYTSASFVTGVSPAAIRVDDTSCDSPTANLTAAECRDRRLKWLVGLDNGTPYKRCTADGCNLVGDFLHAVPRAVPGRPNELLNDGSYDAFKVIQKDAKRPSVLYAASNDGFLHAFKLAPVADNDPAEVMTTKTLGTNELWAFVPPAALPGVSSLYPGSHQALLDGSPVVKDVVATEDDSLVGYKFKLQRTKSDAQLGTGTWRTILVQGYGAQRPGYYAIDVTNPVPAAGGGPKFLWQLINDDAGNPIFGTGSGTPLITTVYLDGVEVAVAVLPGGYGEAASGGPCNRGLNPSGYASGYTPRDKVPCYTATSSKLARSLTVVRLDSGEILRTFRRALDEAPTLSTLTTLTPLDSPLTGQPIPFPSDVGAVADRVFIGDQDGALWRLSFASKTGKPSEWTMDLFFDAYPSDAGFGHIWSSGQPIVTPPIVSVDDNGNLTVAISTGNQEAVGYVAGQTHYVWSLTEWPNSTRTKLDAKVNWYLPFTDGQRVIGSMALFSKELFFPTMTEAKSDKVCSNGTGRLYGMHYLTPSKPGVLNEGGLVSKLVKDQMSDPTAKFIAAPKLPQNAVLSGVSVAQEPTCENPGTAGDDQYFSYGTHTALGTPTVGKFQLFVPTGTEQGASGAGTTSIDQGGAFAQVFDLPALTVTTRVDSWAAIVE